MPVSESRLKATSKWQKKAYFSFHLRFKKEDEEEIRQYGGDNLNGFIVAAVKEKIERIKAENSQG